MIDCVTGLEWERIPADETYTQADAVTHCASLALEGGGWRLPSTVELLTLVDFDVTPPGPPYGPAIDVSAFPGTPPDNYWTSQTLENSAWFVYFYPGATQPTGATVGMRARCVR